MAERGRRIDDVDLFFFPLHLQYSLILIFMIVRVWIKGFERKKTRKEKGGALGGERKKKEGREEEEIE